MAELAIAQKRREQREEESYKRQEAYLQRREAADKRREAAEKKREQREEESYKRQEAYLQRREAAEKRREQREEESYKRQEAYLQRQEAYLQRQEAAEKRREQREEEAYKRRQQQEEAYLQRREQALVKGEEQNAESRKILQEFMKVGNKRMGGLENNIGAASEEYFYRFLETKMQLSNIKFDSIDRNVIVHRSNGEDRCEFDIVLFNSSSAAIIEVKQKAAAEKEVLRELANRKVDAFRDSDAKYKGYAVYFGVASMITNDAMTAAAKELGIFLLTQRGDAVVVVNGEARPMA